jgi:hypothetical protein
MIRSFFRLPLGFWGFCEFPSTIGNRAVFGRIRNGRDLLVWAGRLELVLGRERRERLWFRLPYRDDRGDANLGSWHWDLFSPHR